MCHCVLCIRWLQCTPCVHLVCSVQFVCNVHTVYDTYIVDLLQPEWIVHNVYTVYIAHIVCKVMYARCAAQKIWFTVGKRQYQRSVYMYIWLALGRLPLRPPGHIQPKWIVNKIYIVTSVYTANIVCHAFLWHAFGAIALLFISSTKRSYKCCPV